MSASYDLLGEVSDQICDARMNQKYHAWLADRFTYLDRLLRVIGAVTGSGAVASFALWKDGSPHALWIALTLVSAVASAAAAAVPPAEIARRHRELRQRFTNLRFSFEQVRIDGETANSSSNPALLEKFKELLKERQRVETEQDAPSRRLLQRAYREVLSESAEESKKEIVRKSDR